MGRKVDVSDLVSAPEVAARLGLNDRNVAHSWLRRYPQFPRPVATLAIGHVWCWSEVEGWARCTGRGRWDHLPPGLVAGDLVMLRVWAAEHDVMAEDLIKLASEGLLPLAKRGCRFYLDPMLADAIWTEHGERMLARRLVVPGRRIGSVGN